MYYEGNKGDEAYSDDHKAYNRCAEEGAFGNPNHWMDGHTGRRVDRKIGRQLHRRTGGWTDGMDSSCFFL